MKRRGFLSLIGAGAAYPFGAHGQPKRVGVLVSFAANDPDAQFQERAPEALGLVSSAGVFNSSGQLVRTIWSAQTNDPLGFLVQIAEIGAADAAFDRCAGSWFAEHATSSAEFIILEAGAIVAGLLGRFDCAAVGVAAP
jgi:hypothetical protein